MKVSVILLASLALVNCAGPKGSSGPMGPEGERGLPGQDGTNGKDGTDGAPGVGPGRSVGRRLGGTPLVCGFRGGLRRSIPGLA